MIRTKLILAMVDKLKNNNWGKYPVSLFLSVLFHSILFLAAAYYFSAQFSSPMINSVYLTLQKENSPQKKEVEETVSAEKIKNEELTNEVPQGAYFRFEKSEYDTSDIKQVYRESTLNVSVRYPNGWTFLDQNVKNKLDGVTFWSAQGNYEIPPYVHLEVQDKYIFNPSRWVHKLEHKGNIYYYNDPEEMEGYFTQIIYIRTDSDEDYSLKLLVKGKEIFQSFQPVFFSMAKSFSFGKSFF
jgi:hypothetical protein